MTKNLLGNEENNQDVVLAEDDTIDLLGFIHYLRPKILYILLLFVLGGVLSGIFTKFFIKPTYSATTKLYIVSISNDSQVNLSDLQIGTSLTADYEQLILTRDIIESVISKLDLEDIYTYEELISDITISNPDNTRVINIMVTTIDPQYSMDIANELANVSVDKLGDLMGTVSPSIAEKAVYSDRPVAPNIAVNIIFGCLLFSIGYIVILLVVFVLDNKVKSEDDIEKYLGTPPIGVIPDMPKK